MSDAPGVVALLFAYPYCVSSNAAAADHIVLSSLSYSYTVLNKHTLKRKDRWRQVGGVMSFFIQGTSFFKGGDD